MNRCELIRSAPAPLVRDGYRLFPVLLGERAKFAGTRDSSQCDASIALGDKGKDRYQNEPRKKQLGEEGQRFRWVPGCNGENDRGYQRPRVPACEKEHLKLVSF